MINVSWKDAQEYCEWLSLKTGKRYRLPSETEREYAARSGGKEDKWAGTSDEGELGNYARYNQKKKSDWGTHPVGEKKPNGLGLHDMSGNVWEWVADCRNEHYKGAPDDGTAWESGECWQRVIRGGSWNSNQKNVRAAQRNCYNPDERHLNIGFRLARDL